jgi:hypothetical protein
MNARTVTHTVLLLKIEGLTNDKFNYWRRVRDDGEIFWRNRLYCKDLGRNLDWLINYNR